MNSIQFFAGPMIGGRRMMLLLVASMVLAAACVPISAPPAAPDASSDPLDNTNWVLVRLEADPPVDFDAATVEVTLGFAEGQVGGRSGCNQYGGSYVIDGDGLTVGALFSTMMACPEPLMAVEAAFTDALSAAERYELSNGELTIIHPTGRLTFTPAVADAEAEADAAAEPLSGLLTGAVTYRQRMALPAGAVIDVQLQDVSRADAAATIIAEQRIITSGEQAPFPFELSYDPAQIDERMTYALAARIMIDDQLAWINTSHHAVLTRGAPATDVVVEVEPVQSGASSPEVTLVVAPAAIVLPDHARCLWAGEGGRLGGWG
ncbi:MAG: YbaY family lipoprotein [Caldilineaceae bacterium]|nr:YbaY family lipoprotein [Caldilineaceae bacterium]